MLEGACAVVTLVRLSQCMTSTLSLRKLDELAPLGEHEQFPEDEGGCRCMVRQNAQESPLRHGTPAMEAALESTSSKAVHHPQRATECCSTLTSRSCQLWGLRGTCLPRLDGNQDKRMTGRRTGWVVGAGSRGPYSSFCEEEAPVRALSCCHIVVGFGAAASRQGLRDASRLFFICLLTSHRLTWMYHHSAYALC